MVSVIIPVFNKVELTRRCLNSVLQNSKITTEVFMIDNASTDTTFQELQDWALKFQEKGILFEITSNSKNLGFGSACNQGIRQANGEYVAILNNDTWVMPGWDQALSEELITHGLDEVGPHFDERPIGEHPEAVAEEFLKKNPVRLRKHFVPILIFFTKSAIQRLKFEHGGIFDELFFVTYEDTDLLHRMKLLKMKFGQTSRCYIWHHSMGTRSTPGLLPEGYEVDGLKKFIGKWGFDPRKSEHTFIERLKRRWRKSRSKMGLF